MPDSNKIYYISLDNVELYDELIKNYIRKEDAKSLKTVMLSSDGKKLLFYRTTEPISEGAVPAYEIALPDVDLSGVMKKVVSALEGNIGIFNGTGSIIDSGMKIADVATHQEVASEVAKAIAQTAHLNIKLVDALPLASNAQTNTLYLVKDNTATGEDKYKEYLLLSGAFVCIGDTSTNLSGYYTSEQTNAKINSEILLALISAAQDAQNKANTAEANANKYTDQKIAEIDFSDIDLSGVTDDIATLQRDVGINTQRIEVLESTRPDISIATEEQIRALFTSSN